MALPSFHWDDVAVGCLGVMIKPQDRATFSVSFPARNKQIEKTAETYGNTTWRHSSGHFALWAEVVHRQ